MRIVTLIENTPGAPGCAHEHGLSLYVETGRHTLLLDTGATGAFAANAAVLGLDLGRVDTIVLSHGHYDHNYVQSLQGEPQVIIGGAPRTVGSGKPGASQ